MADSSFLRALALSLPLGLAAAPAMATTVTLDKTGSNVHGSNGKATVQITGVSGSVSAGGFDVKVTAGSHGIAYLADRFTAWCLDIANTLHLASDYQVTTSPFSIDPLTSAQKGDIRALFNTGYDAGNLSNNIYSAGFQLALWEIVNETDGAYNLSSGTFAATGNASAVTEANNLLANLGGTATGNWRVVYLESQKTNPASQNLVTVAAVPLPAAGLMLLGALGMLGVARRRRQRT